MAGMEFYLPMAVTVVIAALGWVLAHRFTSSRDRKNAERTLRLTALGKAYSILVRASLQKSIVMKGPDGHILPTAHDIEDAIASIHLYGTPTQSRLANKLAADMSQHQRAEYTELVNDLRKYIRTELNLAELGETPSYLRIEVVDTRTTEETKSS